MIYSSEFIVLSHISMLLVRTRGLRTAKKLSAQLLEELKQIKGKRRETKNRVEINGEGTVAHWTSTSGATVKTCPSVTTRRLHARGDRSVQDTLLFRDTRPSSLPINPQRRKVRERKEAMSRTHGKQCSTALLIWSKSSRKIASSDFVLRRETNSSCRKLMGSGRWPFSLFLQFVFCPESCHLSTSFSPGLHQKTCTLGEDNSWEMETWAEIGALVFRWTDWICGKFSADLWKKITSSHYFVSVFRRRWCRL